MLVHIQMKSMLARNLVDPALFITLPIHYTTTNTNQNWVSDKKDWSVVSN